MIDEHELDTAEREPAETTPTQPRPNPAASLVPAERTSATAVLTHFAPPTVIKPSPVELQPVREVAAGGALATTPSPSLTRAVQLQTAPTQLLSAAQPLATASPTLAAQQLVAATPPSVATKLEPTTGPSQPVLAAPLVPGPREK